LLLPDLPVFQKLSSIASQMDVKAYAVGGYIRDLILKRNSKDIDIAVEGDALQMAQFFAAQYPQQAEFAYFKNFGTAMVKTNEWEVEFVSARKESYTHQSRNPKVKPGSIDDDLKRRDFTMNAIAVCISPSHFQLLLDPFGGVEDIRQKLIRTPLDADTTFSDDPLRMMRAIRFASQLQFNIHPQTFEAIGRNKNRIEIISKERITDELNKIILSPQPSLGLKLLSESGLLAIIFPELEAMKGIEVREGKAHKDNFLHTLQVLDQVSADTDDLWIRWVAILHDIAKPVTKRFTPGEGWTFHGHEDKGSRMVNAIFNRMKLPLNEKMKFVKKIVALHHRPKALAMEGITDSAIRRLLVDAGDDMDALFLFCRSDMTSRNQQKINGYRQNLEHVRKLIEDVEQRDHLRNWQPPITGQDIMRTFGIKPSREVGIIKEEIREAILEGKIPNTHQDAYQLMLQVAKNIGLTPLK
jgi:tRNA nucleotidyltransferase/poly(A) polymerase